MKNKGITFKLSAYIISATVLIFLSILFYYYQYSKKMLLREAYHSAQQLTTATINEIETILSSTQKIPSNLVYSIENSNVQEVELLNMLSRIVENNPEIYGSCIAFEPYCFLKETEQYAPYFYKSKEGIAYKSLGEDSSYNYLNQDWYTLPKTQNKAIWTEPYFDEGGGNILMTTYAVPFHDHSSDQEIFRGVITADISLDWLERLMDSTKIYKTGYAFLISHTGTIITHPISELRMTESIFSLAERYSRPDVKKIGEDMVLGNSKFLPYAALTDSTPFRIYYAPLPKSNWSMAVIFPEAELFADLKKLHRTSLLIGILGITGLFLIIILISRNITKPLRKLAINAERIGSGNFDVTIKCDNAAREITMLGNTFMHMQQELKKYIKNLEITTAAKEKIESELKIAHDIQQGMIHIIFPPFPERKDVDLYAILEPARQVGGDLYDFFFLDDETLCFAIGDVSDKGVPASLLMAITLTLLRSKANKTMEVNEIVKSINNSISKENENMMFVTFFLGLLNLKTGELSYCNAGHNYPYLISQNQKVEELEQTHGPPLGIKENHQYKYETIKLKKSDSLVLFTDGVTEATSKNGDFYGDERLKKPDRITLFKQQPKNNYKPYL